MPLACVPPRTKFSEHLVGYNGLDESIKIPVMYEGKVVTIFKPD